MTGLNIHLDNTMGCVLVGVLFAVVLYGCSCAQTMFYIQEYPKDTIFLKTLVGALWLLDTSRTGLDIAFLWHYTVPHHADIAALEIFQSTFTAEFFLASLTVWIVQLYYIYTIWRLLAGRWFQLLLSTAAIALSTMSFAGGTATVYFISQNPGVTNAVIAATIPASIQTVTAFVTDAYITTCLCLILYGEGTGFKRTETLLSKLMLYAIHRGIITSVVQLCHFATYISTIHDNGTLIWMVFHIPGSKIYVNSLLAVLNVRRRLREGGSSHATTDYSVDVIPLDSVGPNHSSSTRITRSRPTQTPSISRTRIMLTKEVIRDDGVPTPPGALEKGGTMRKPPRL
ncbi:hypothetical protein AcV7_001103 [Taiwanofungus camphoratus]|nr:hypothetical protein AcV7_001103 [Antrodia cinnamomea]